MSSLSRHATDLAAHLFALDLPRAVVAIAGAPGAGKAALAAETARQLTLGGQRCVVVHLDAFALDNSVLEARNHLARKGAPDTFDVGGFARMIRAIRAGEDVYAPFYDRTRDIALAGAVPVPAHARVVLVTGSYLMYDDAPWQDLAGLWDVTVRLDVPLPELRARLIHRWLSLNLSRAVATRRTESNDIPNAQRVIARALPCDLVFDSLSGLARPATPAS